uniref:Fibrillin-1 n=1 Tax=Magallana gigas TaxID=29159 RepID=A0A8W8N521_MAGGI
MAFYIDNSKRVSFQILIVSDGQNLFSVTNYININIQVLQGSHVSIGHRYRAFRGKNTYSWKNAAFRMSSVPGNTGYNGFWVQKLTDDNIKINPLEKECYSWYSRQTLSRRPNAWWLTCPCTGTAMRFFGFQFAFYRTEPGMACYVSLTFGTTLECCYSVFGFFSLGPLIRRIPDAGSTLSANPFFQPVDYYIENQRPKEACCASGHCDWYYTYRPRPFFCSRFIPVRTAWFWGDPHINTLDGGQYTFNGYGEYTMMKIDHNGTQFELQARTDLATTANGTTINATIFSAFVAKDHTGSIVQVEMSRNRDKMYVRANGRDVTTEIDSNPDFVLRTINMTLSKDNGTVVASFVQSAITIKISLGVRFLTSETMVDERYNGKVVGLMGNFDGNSTNDFVLPNNTILFGSAVNSERKIYENFGQLWSINSNTSYFHYDTGLSHANYTHPEFVPFYIDEQPQDKVNRSREVCGGASASQACIFDYLATGDESLAKSSGDDAETSARDTATLENESPQISGDSQINAQVNRSVELKFNATDDGTFVYRIIQQPPGFSFNNNSGIARWTPQDDSVTNISITVVDDKGEEAAPIDVAIVLCSGCNDHGTCDYNTTRTSTSDMFKYAACNCTIGYSGRDCENDTDGCAATPCALGRTCVDIKAEDEAVLGRGYNCSDCPPGYKIVDEKCEDINECNSTTSNTCDDATEYCVNSEGSFECNCNRGFRKVGSICQDIDECTESTSGCEQLCTNSAGSFECSCISGYILNSDNKTCTGTSNCPGLNCEYACNNDSDARPVCICKNGYELKDSENCTDIDECKMGGVCSQDCENLNGSYICSCYAGYSLNDDRTTCSACEPPNYGVNCQSICSCGQGMERCDPVTGCVCKSGWTGSNCDTDINECSTNPTICGSDKICQNLDGSHACNCRNGYEKDSNDNCIDINECGIVTSNNCSTSTSICKNKDGGYVCECKSGFTQKNLYECEDFNECTAGIDGCSQKCLNVDGGYNCECEFGYTLGDDRKTCIKVQDICSLFPQLNCTYGCKANGTRGSCFCPAGFLLNAQNHRSCIDIDECNDASLNQCTFPNLCVNVDGSYNCSCPDYHVLENDGRTCKECDGFSFGKTCENVCNCGIGSSRCDKEKGCVCLSGWTGVECDLDIDECAASTNPCTSNHQVCQNSPGSYKCICETGFMNESGLCKDINECENSPCSQICTNTEGSYSCSCNGGFRMSANSECMDFDECLAPVSPCDQQCTNTIGSYKCSCNDGFILNSTSRTTCYAKTECTNTALNCSQKCGVKPGGVEYCFCNVGYSLNANQMSCDDIDDCQPNPCSENCNQNAPGQGYNCSCAPGKKLDIDQRSCIDCENGRYGDKCSLNCACNVENTIVCDKVLGNCTCKPGWEGMYCTEDIDECKNTSICPENSVCQNTNGSFSCVCDSGYSQAAGKCVECALNTYGQNCASQCSCDFSNTQLCDKKNGTCYCKEGWQGADCTEDVLECANTTICGSNARCSETNGSYICNCDVGYKKDAFGSCADVDECSLGSDTCHENADCTNIVGNFTCSCKTGFSGDGYSCTACDSTHYGVGCSSPCTCIEDNTVDCNDVTGQCNCKTTWNGTNCDVDVNECDLGTNGCNSTIEICVNRDDGWNCSCLHGSTNGVCNEMTTSTMTESTYESTQTIVQSTVESSESTEASPTTTGGSESTTKEMTTSTMTESTYESTQTIVQSTVESSESTEASPTTTGGSESTTKDITTTTMTESTYESTQTTVQSTVASSQSTEPSPTTTGGSESTTKEKVTAYVPQTSEVKLGVVVTFRKNISLTNYDQVVKTMESSLTNFYKSRITGFIKVLILVIRRGSTIVEHEVIANKTEKANQDLVTSMFILSKSNIKYENENLTTSSVLVKDDTGRKLVITNTSSKCDVYVISNPCGENEKCVEDEKIAYCRTETRDSNDNFQLILGLGVGITLLTIAIFIGIIIFCYFRRRRHPKDTSLSSSDVNIENTFGEQGMYFVSGMPTKIDSWGRYWSPYSPHHIWSEEPEGFNITREPNSYDNAEQSRFSWDFMCQALQPNEKFKIKRPEFSTKPLNPE